MNKLQTKTLKILLFIGVFAYLQYHDIKRGSFSANSIMSGLLAASLVYIIASIYGIVLDLTMNYLIAIIITVLLLFFFASKLDALIASVSWLTDDRMLYILTGLATLCFIRDIIIIKNSLFGAQTTISDETLSESNVDDNTNIPIKSLRQTCNENPEFMLSLSKDFEKRKGHKPTYEELLEYIDKEAFHLLSDEEIKLETQAIVEQARRKARQQQLNRQ